ncbi:MAG: 2Fe-2S iron-sulfur cluster-binding protein [Segniliparus sp.]|uniref:2Fe-2S iron-sulfur cluster-binding protein n=1 Tax=Segniliparus sp. TaxID=2804064 RepID=UPI003F3ED5EC
MPDGALMRLFKRRHVEPVPTADPAECFEVELRQSGITVTVPPGLSVLAAIRAKGIHIESMCGNGICGTCQTRLLSGQVEHRDEFLTDDEHERFMTPCVSRAPAGGHVVLDL